MPITRHLNQSVGSLSQYQLLVPILLILALLSIVANVRAQEYYTGPLDEKARANRTVAQQSIKDPAIYAANKAKFDEYFKNYHFPMMTRTEPDKLAELGKFREELFKLFLWKTTNAQLQQDLTELSLAEMKTIVAAKNPPAHPAARYNAILIIGMLDDQYSDGRQPPKPSVAANKVLTIVVSNATTSNVFSPAVILGALIGLERHAQLHESLPPESVAAMSAALLKLVATDTPIQEMDRDAYSWMRLRAASALARLGSVGDKNAVHNAIIKLAGSGKSLDDRCAAAALLEKINYKDVKLDDAGTAEPLFALTRDVAAAEDKRAQEFQDNGSTLGSSRPGGPEGFAPPAGPGADDAYPRRSALSRLNDLRTGLKAIKPALPAETQKTVDAVIAALNPAITAAGSKETVPLRVAEAIRTMAAAINKAVPAAEKPADKAKENDAF